MRGETGVTFLPSFPPSAFEPLAHFSPVGVHRTYMPRQARTHTSVGPTASKSSRESARACNTCRARKGRCDGNGIDPCTWCREKRQDCSYNPEDRKKTPWNKQTRESHQELVNGLMSANEKLSAEIESMQNYIRNLGIEPPGQLLEAIDGMSSDEQSGGASSPDASNPFTPIIGGTLSTTSSVAPSLASASPPSSNVRRSVSLSKSDIDEIDHCAAIHADDTWWRRHLPEDAVIDGPGHERITQLYFKFLCSWIYRHVPQLYWKDMYISMKYGTFEKPIRTAHWSPFLQNAILALAIPISEDDQVRSRENRQRFANKAGELMDNEFDHPSISALLGFSTLACYYSGMGEHTTAYTFFGFCVRMSGLLKLQTDPRKRLNGHPITPADNEDMVNRVWAFWTTFTADVWLSVYMGREFSMDLVRAEIPLPTIESLPIDENLWVAPGVEDAGRPNLFRETFVEFCKLTMIAIKIINMVYGMDRQGYRRLDQTVVRKVDAELNDWYSNLPEGLSSTSFALPHTLMMHMVFWYSIILLHQPTYRANPNAKTTSRKLCHRGSRVITDILQQWRDLYTLRLVPVPLLNVVFTAGSTWLIAVSERSHKRSTSEQYLRNAEKCLEMLKEMAPLWESADLLYEMFTRLIVEEREKRRAEEERWLITEAGTGGPRESTRSSSADSSRGRSMSDGGNVDNPPRTWDHLTAQQTGVTVYSSTQHPQQAGTRGNSSGATASGYSYSSEEEGAHVHSALPTPSHAVAPNPTSQHYPVHHQHYLPHPHPTVSHFQPHSATAQAQQAHTQYQQQQEQQQAIIHGLPSHSHLPTNVYGGGYDYNLPPLAEPGPIHAGVLPSMQTGHPHPQHMTQGLGLFGTTPYSSMDITESMLDDNDAICGLKRTGVWMNPLPHMQMSVYVPFVYGV